VKEPNQPLYRCALTNLILRFGIVWVMMLCALVGSDYLADYTASQPKRSQMDYYFTSEHCFQNRNLLECVSNPVVACDNTPPECLFYRVLSCREQCFRVHLCLRRSGPSSAMRSAVSAYRPPAYPCFRLHKRSYEPLFVALSFAVLPSEMVMCVSSTNIE
jgi:hypothetical protein